MRIPFVKMHGLGNDFVVLDGRGQSLPAISAAFAAAVADRHRGIGCDQLIVLEPSGTADFRMRIFNADGGEVESCGNAARAVGLLHGAPARIETLSGIVAATPSTAGISVEMGRPRFEWNEIPLAYAMDTHAMPVAWEELENPVAVNVGNPHVVFFVPDCDAVDLDRIGPLIEHDALFPERVNVNVATVVSRRDIRLRVWERGAGLTLACGTGACATAVAAVVTGRHPAGQPLEVELPGGVLSILVAEGLSRVWMEGPAVEVFQGTVEI